MIGPFEAGFILGIITACAVGTIYFAYRGIIQELRK
jgi:hypothetical protein